MTMPLSLIRDNNGYNTFGLRPSQNIVSTTLSNGVEQSITVPYGSENWLAVFQRESGTDIYIAYNATATLPESSFADTNSECNPPCWEVKAGDTLHFITGNTTAEITVKYYTL
jgi:hypothetical protein